MSDVTSLEVSKELYEVSGWEEDTHDWYGENKTYIAPRYTLGYLVRKLPKQLYNEEAHYWFWLSLGPIDTQGTWSTSYDMWIDEEVTSIYLQSADTPEDAAGKLLIELFKQGILTKS